MSHVTISPASEQGESSPENVTSPVSRRARLIYERGDIAAPVRLTTRDRLAGSVTAATATGLIPSPPAGIRHMTETDLARRWRVSPRTLQAWRWKGRGPAYLRVCGRVLYRIEDIIEFETISVRKGGR